MGGVNMKGIKLISMYLTAIVMANLLTVKFGPKISILNAFLFIGLDLTSRDKLHELWHGDKLFGYLMTYVHLWDLWWNILFRF